MDKDTTLEFYEIEKYLTEKERNHHLALTLNGTHEYDEKNNLIVMMGIKAYQAIQDFQNEMIAKYKDKIIQSLVDRPRGSNYTPPKKKRK